MTLAALPSALTYSSSLSWFSLAFSSASCISLIPPLYGLVSRRFPTTVSLSLIAHVDVSYRTQGSQLTTCPDVVSWEQIPSIVMHIYLHVRILFDIKWLGG